MYDSYDPEDEPDIERRRNSDEYCRECLDFIRDCICDGDGETVTYIDDLCVSCFDSTVPGSGKFVNRIPADTGTLIGWLCADCQENDDAPPHGIPRPDVGERHPGFREAL